MRSYSPARVTENVVDPLVLNFFRLCRSCEIPDKDNCLQAVFPDRVLTKSPGMRGSIRYAAFDDVIADDAVKDARLRKMNSRFSAVLANISFHRIEGLK